MNPETRNVLITGGAEGLGRYLARHLLSRGHRVLVLDRAPIEDLPAEYRESLAAYLQVDLADWSAVRDCVSRILENNEQRIEVLINNAASRTFANFHEFKARDIDQCIQVNFRTPVLLAHQLLPSMREYGYGRIINISSRSAFRSYRTGSLYCSTKNALVAFTESVGRELAASGDNITINAICPDSFRTREGQDLPGAGKILATIAKAIDTLLTSRRNGEIISAASRWRLLEDALSAFRKRGCQLLKNLTG